ncbi:hydroxyethylthiazole kinase [Clostridium ihumii]|uniref:hydroxyethylthiazole kinase n=1 Tax=Clostridium ihumii TaxID=1470356 RepID=UPI00058E3CB9|nr:hydroxyethylthiazole kinase [Clostridium ihumii]
MINEFSKYINVVREKKPLVYHITNAVTINDCANVTLAIGASPLMSFCEDELEEILSFASALVINIGTMDKSMINIVKKAGMIANRLKKPVILDPVGAGATSARKKLLEDLVKNIKFDVIKGNMAEIKSILGLNITVKGVDSIENMENAVELGKALSEKLDTTVVITGKEDVICYKKKVAKINNGHEMMARITGTGCMTASLIGSYIGAIKDGFIAATLGTLSMSLCGENAVKDLKQGEGTGSLRVGIIDKLSLLDEKQLEMGDVIFE